jgi:Ala-tRNA(Pro) deacylase
MPDTYSRLINLLDASGARYVLIDHEPEGRTELVSRLRGHDVSAAAKCIVVMVKIGKKVTRNILAVVPGDRRVDLEACKTLCGGTYVTFASRELAERVSGSVAGAILPFAFDPSLELIVDPAVLRNERLHFNAGRLDRSIALITEDYLSIARPRIEQIAQQEGEL